MLSSKEASHSRGRGTPGRSHSPPRTLETIDSAQKAREEVLARQMAEFAAMDQTILSKKVGLPDVKVEPIPLKFDKKPMPEPVENEAAAAEEGHTEQAPSEADEDQFEDTVTDLTEQLPVEAKDEDDAKTEDTETDLSDAETAPEVAEPMEPVESEVEGTTSADAEEGEPAKEVEVDEPEPSESEFHDPETKEDEPEEPKIATPQRETRNMDTPEPETPQPREARENTTTVSVSHVVTNVIILQSFLFELAALIQVRAGLFDEVRFV